jgi:hypothetical protein
VATQDPRRQRALVVPTKADRVARFHANTLQALKELVQAAGLHHPGQITPAHIVRRVREGEVRLLANLLPFLAPGALLDAAEGRRPWPHAVYATCWPLAQGDSFAPLAGHGRPVVAAAAPTAVRA